MSLRYLIAFVAACAPAPAPIAVEPAARAHGVVGMTVVVDRPDALEVVVDTIGGPRALHVSAAAGVTEQVLDGFSLRTERDAIAIGDLVARRDRGWSAAPLPPAETEALARILALDITLAVQGSSLVFDGDDYVPCTLRCTRAEACAHDLARCGDDIVVCGACLVREP